MKRLVGMARVATLMSLAGVMGLAIWYRLSSLDALPIHTADESYYGIQAWRLAYGQEFRLRTTSGNLIDPFLLLMQVPLHWVASPSVGLIRLPVALCGLVAIGLVFATADRTWDRGAAVWGTLLLATLPMSIAFSRMACEFGQTPAAGALAAWFALRGRGWGFFLAVVAALLVHPTNVFLILVFGPAFLIATRRRWEGDADGARRAWRRIVAVAIGLVLASGLALARRPIVQDRLREALAHLGELDWGVYLNLLVRKLLRDCPAIIDPAVRAWPWIVGVLGLVVVGGVLLARRRQWDRLAVVAGTLAGVFALHLLGGSRVMESEDRYASVLLVPLALTVGALAGAIGRNEEARTWHIGLLPAAALGGLLLWTTHTQFIQPIAALIPGESIWTFRSDGEDPHAELLRHVRHDLANQPPGRRDNRPANPPLLVTEHYFVTKPLEYLSCGTNGPRVVELITLPELGEIIAGGDSLARNAAQMTDRLRSGDYVVGGIAILPQLERWVEGNARASFPGPELRVWRPSVVASGLQLFRVDPAEGLSRKDERAGRR